MEWRSSIRRGSLIITAWTLSVTLVIAAEVCVDTLLRVIPSSAFVGMVSILAPIAMATVSLGFGAPVLDPPVSLLIFFIHVFILYFICSSLMWAVVFGITTYTAY